MPYMSLKFESPIRRGKVEKLEMRELKARARCFRS